MTRRILGVAAYADAAVAEHTYSGQTLWDRPSDNVASIPWTLHLQRIKCPTRLAIFSIRGQRIHKSRVAWVIWLLRGQTISPNACCRRHKSHDACCVACQIFVSRWTNGAARDGTGHTTPSALAQPARFAPDRHCATRAALRVCAVGSKRSKGPLGCDKIPDDKASKLALATAVTTLQQPCEAYWRTVRGRWHEMNALLFRRSEPAWPSFRTWILQSHLP